MSEKLYYDIRPTEDNHFYGEVSTPSYGGISATARVFTGTIMECQSYIRIKRDGSI
jgi:hypothetical protein